MPLSPTCDYVNISTKSRGLPPLHRLSPRKIKGLCRTGFGVLLAMERSGNFAFAESTLAQDLRARRSDPNNR